MPLPALPAIDPLVTAAFWSAATIGFYLLAKALYRRHRRWWLSPLISAPILLLLVGLALHASYHAYLTGTHWMILLLGPATVALAVPIYQQRGLIRRHWPELLLGIVAGSATALLSSWWLARKFRLDDALHIAPTPHSAHAGAALLLNAAHGGPANLTAAFVILSGLMGAALGEALLIWLPLRSVLARGTLLGLGTHGAANPRAHRHGREEVRVAGLVMVLVGLFDVIGAAPFMTHMLR